MTIPIDKALERLNAIMPEGTRVTRDRTIDKHLCLCRVTSNDVAYAGKRVVIETYPEALGFEAFVQVPGNSMRATADMILGREPLAEVETLVTRKGVAMALVRHYLDLGYFISVNDGEELCLSNSDNANEISGSLMSTDLDMIIINDAQGHKRGHMLFVWDNSPAECPSDYTLSLEDGVEKVRKELGLD